MKQSIVYLRCKNKMTYAAEILLKAEKEDEIYKNIRYVKKSSKIAFDCVLKAIDKYLQLKENKLYVKPTNIDDYKNRLKVINKELFCLFIYAYDLLYIIGYYYGSYSPINIDEGYKTANEIIDYIKD